MIPCPSCRSHVRSAPGETAPCAFCGVTIDARALTGAALLLGLALQGCGSTSVPLYGVAVTDVVEETGDTGDTDPE